MKPFALFVLLIALPSLSHADEERLVGIKCNQSTDRLIVYYFAPKPAGEADASTKQSADEWRASDLVEVVNDRYEVHGVTRSCALKHGLYTISIQPDPDNPNPNGYCGAVISFFVNIRRGDESILSAHRLDSESCNNPDGKTTVRIVVDAKSPKPKLTTVRSGDL